MKIKIILSFFAIIFCLGHVVSANEAHRYYYNPFYATAEFAKSYETFPFAKLPKLYQEQAIKKANSSSEVKKTLSEDANYFLYPLESSYTDDEGKTWTDWEIGVAKVVMNQTMRVDAVFGVNPFDGKIIRLNRPVMSMPFQGE